MTILTLNKKELEKRIGILDSEKENLITQMGTPVDASTKEELCVEIFPNRPDLLSLENFSRAVNQYQGKEGFARFKINKPQKNYVVKIEKSVKSVRPYTVCAIVKGLKFNDEKIKEIIELQENLHNSIGRKRKKLAIGIYPLEEIALPITFKALPPHEIVFQPLDFPRKINGAQILRQHPTGRGYANLLKDEEKFPVFVDAKGEILSMPPIINSDKTGRISNSTKDVFIECSGHNLHYLNKTLNIIIATFAKLGGRIYSMRIEDKSGKKYTTPEMEPQRLKFKIEDINRTLGIELNEKQITKYLAKMGIELEKVKKDFVAIIPSYRTDILHWIDLAEEVALGYGYENFEPVLPEISTIAHESLKEKRKEMLSEILAGLGLLEVSSYHLTTKKNIKKIYYDFTDFIELEASKTERDVLRYDLLTNHLQILSENSNSAYPQKIFEIGTTFEKDEKNKTETGIIEKEKLAVSLSDEKISFTDIKQVLDYLFKMLDKKYEIVDSSENPAYIPGRGGQIKVDGKIVGHIGELCPRVLKNWKVKMPVVAFEMDLSFLLD